MRPGQTTPLASCIRGRMGGLTLVELALSVAVLAVLGMLAVQAYGGWRERAQVAQAQNDIIAMASVIDQQWQDTQTLPASLAAIGRGGLRDPWGNAYQYLQLGSPASTGKARKDHSLVPLNSDYDLYSRGPDGRSQPPLTAKASRDDILRANNGAFIGPASKY
ncbi:prepilin-type cleavage/methylation domain-containing protein [Rubrivivax sp. RP6-9]|uniref:prepilin-type cleavage/methylation domain-containing protein n=1 Tax=Rubrivivax sp. RP6-9 TaxID=3415750 RepID=UPI003CC59F33